MPSPGDLIAKCLRSLVPQTSETGDSTGQKVTIRKMDLWLQEWLRNIVRSWAIYSVPLTWELELCLSVFVYREACVCLCVLMYVLCAYVHIHM